MEHKAYVVGAYPLPYQRIVEKLNEMGIGVAGHCEKERDFLVPKHASFILLISDQVNHGMANIARAQSSKSGMMIVAGPYKNWSNLQDRLIQKGIGYRTVVKSDTSIATIGDLVAMKNAEKNGTEASPASLVQETKITEPLHDETKGLPAWESFTQSELEEMVLKAKANPKVNDKAAFKREILAKRALQFFNGQMANVDLAQAVKRVTGKMLAENKINPLRAELNIPLAKKGTRPLSYVQINKIEAFLRGSTVSTETVSTQPTLPVPEVEVNETVETTTQPEVKTTVRHLSGDYDLDTKAALEMLKEICGKYKVRMIVNVSATHAEAEVEQTITRTRKLKL
jgi:hypothetical protein